MRQFTRPILFNSVVGQRILWFSKIGCALLLVSVAISIFFPVVASSRAAARMATNKQNLKDLSLAMILNGEKNEDHLPPAESWMNAIGPFVKNPESFQSPFRNNGEYGYAMNADLSSALIGSLPNPQGTILIYPTKRSGRNLSAHGNGIADDLDHDQRRVGYLGGSVHYLDRVQVDQAAKSPEEFRRLP